MSTCARLILYLEIVPFELWFRVVYTQLRHLAAHLLSAHYYPTIQATLPLKSQTPPQVLTRPNRVVMEGSCTLTHKPTLATQ